MSIRHGTSTPTLRVGADTVTRAYYGTSLVYEADDVLLHAVDRFDRAATSSGLGSHPIGAPYVVRSGTWGITADGQAYVSSTDPGGSAIVTVATSSSLFDIEATVTLAPNGWWDLLGCFTSFTDCYLLEVQADGAFYVLNRRAGTTQVPTTPPGTIKTGDAVRFVRPDAFQLEVHINGVLHSRVPTGGDLTATAVGLRMGSSGAVIPGLRWNDFAITALPAPPPPPPVGELPAKLYAADVAFYETPIPASPALDPLSAQAVGYFATWGLLISVAEYNAVLVTAGEGVRRFSVGDTANPLHIRFSAFISPYHPDMRGWGMTVNTDTAKYNVGDPYIGFPVSHYDGARSHQFVVVAVQGDRRTAAVAPNFGAATQYGQLVQDGNVTWMHVGSYATGGDTNYGDCILNGVSVPIPEHAQAANGSDGHLAILDETTGNWYMLWQTDIERDAAGNITGVACSFGSVDSAAGDGRNTQVYWNAQNPWMGGGQVGRGTGSGIAIGMGAPTWTELQAALDAELAGDLENALVPHALVFATNVTQGPSNSPNFRYPATVTDGSLSDWNPEPFRIPEGSRFYLATTDAKIAAMDTPLKRILARTARKFGLYMTDYGGAAFSTSTEAAWNAQQQATLAAFGSSGWSYLSGPGGWDANDLRMLATWNGLGDGEPPPPPASTYTNVRSDSFASGIGTWGTAPGAVTSVVSYSTERGRNGAAGAMKIVSTAGSDQARAESSVAVPVQPGKTYRVRAWLYSVGKGAMVAVGASESDAGGGYLGGNGSPAQSIPPDTWTLFEQSVTYSSNPALAGSFMSLNVFNATMNGGEVYHVDSFVVDRADTA